MRRSPARLCRAARRKVLIAPLPLDGGFGQSQVPQERQFNKNTSMIYHLSGSGAASLSPGKKHPLNPLS